MGSGAGVASGSSADGDARTRSSAGASGGASADVPAAGGSTSLTQPGVTRGIPGQTGSSTGAAAGASSGATGITELQIRDRLRTQGFDDVTGLVRRGDVWEGQVMRNGRSETIRIDPLSGQVITR
jgi:hypothetical protein